MPDAPLIDPAAMLCLVDQIEKEAKEDDDGIVFMLCRYLRTALADLDNSDRRGDHFSDRCNAMTAELESLRVIARGRYKDLIHAKRERDIALADTQRVDWLSEEGIKQSGDRSSSGLERVDVKGETWTLDGKPVASFRVALDAAMAATPREDR